MVFKARTKISSPCVSRKFHPQISVSFQRLKNLEFLAYSFQVHFSHPGRRDTTGFESPRQQMSLPCRYCTSETLDQPLGTVASPMPGNVAEPRDCPSCRTESLPVT